MNLLDRARGEVHVVAVLGHHEVRTALLGTVSTWRDWQGALRHERNEGGAVWLPAGSHEWDTAIPAWNSTAAASVAPDAWHPDDELLLPVRDSSGTVLAILSVDEPLGGLRPSDSDLELLMALAEHAGLVLELLRRGAAPGWLTELAA